MSSKNRRLGDHTPVVQLHHRYWMIMFIALKVMFFVAWFWAYSTLRSSLPMRSSSKRAELIGRRLAAGKGSRPSTPGICRSSAR